MATPTDKQFLDSRNKALKKTYKSVNDYLTDNGARDKNSALYKRRLAALQNFRGEKKRESFVQSEEWSKFLSDEYPGLVNIYNTNPEVAEIIRNAYVQDEPEQETQNKILNSQWYRGLGAGEYNYIIGTTTGDRAYQDIITEKERSISQTASASGYSLSQESIKALAADALKFVWDPARIKNEIGSRVIAESQGTAPGGMGAPTAAPTRLQAGADAASIRAQARSYGVSLTDDQVEGYVQSVIQGRMSTQQVVDNFRNQAKSLYPSIAKQLDSGTLDDAVSSYRSIASQTLGIDSTQVDFTNDKFKKLLTYRDSTNNEYRLMNSAEWGSYLRTLPEWQKTTEASNRYTDLIDSIEGIFGKVR